MLASTANSGCRGEGPFAAHKCRIPGERPEAPIGCGERHAGVHQLHAGEVRLDEHVAAGLELPCERAAALPTLGFARRALTVEMQANVYEVRRVCGPDVDGIVDNLLDARATPAPPGAALHLQLAARIQAPNELSA